MHLCKIPMSQQGYRGTLQSQPSQRSVLSARCSQFSGNNDYIVCNVNSQNSTILFTESKTTLHKRSKTGYNNNNNQTRDKILPTCQLYYLLDRIAKNTQLEMKRITLKCLNNYTPINTDDGQLMVIESEPSQDQSDANQNLLQLVKEQNIFFGVIAIETVLNHIYTNNLCKSIKKIKTHSSNIQKLDRLQSIIYQYHVRMTFQQILKQNGKYQAELIKLIGLMALRVTIKKINQRTILKAYCLISNTLSTQKHKARRSSFNPLLYNMDRFVRVIRRFVFRKPFDQILKIAEQNAEKKNFILRRQRMKTSNKKKCQFEVNNIRIQHPKGVLANTVNRYVNCQGSVKPKTIVQPIAPTIIRTIESKTQPITDTNELIVPMILLLLLFGLAISYSQF